MKPARFDWRLPVIWFSPGVVLLACAYAIVRAEPWSFVGPTMGFAALFLTTATYCTLRIMRR